MKIDDIRDSNKSKKEKYEAAERLFNTSAEWIDKQGIEVENINYEKFLYTMYETSKLYTEYLFEQAELLIKDIKDTI